MRRAVSYNLLADQYASTDYAREHLFSYCPARYLDMGYRKQLILAELQAYHADIILLQVRTCVCVCSCVWALLFTSCGGWRLHCAVCA